MPMRVFTAQAKFAMSTLLSLWFLAGCSKESTSEPLVRELRTMTIGDVSVIQGRSFPGRAKATQEASLSFRVSGPLIARPIKVGDVVEAGDLLARIDPRDYEVQLRNAEGSLQRAQANEQRARSDYRRALQIRRENPGAISEATIDQAKEALDLALADVSALEASVDAAQDELDYTLLQAPFSGSIASIFVENFEFVQAKQPILRLLDKTNIEFEINVPETLISQAHLIDDIEVVFDVFPDIRLPAEVKEIGTEASETTRTFPVTLIMEQPEDALILPGMAGRASGVPRPPSGSGQQEPPPIVIPVTALFSPPGADSSFVWVLDKTDNTVSKRAVEVGAMSNNGLVITSGIEAGEQIAVAGVHFLAEGQKIRPAEE